MIRRPQGPQLESLASGNEEALLHGYFFDKTQVGQTHFQIACRNIWFEIKI